MLKNVRNKPLRLRMRTPVDSATAPTRHPTGPSATDSPRWTNVVGVQVVFDGGRWRIAYSDMRKIVTPPAARVPTSCVTGSQRHARTASDAAATYVATT